MDYKTRVLPTREAIAKIQRLENLEAGLSEVDLVLSLITTADLIRSSIYAKLNKDHDVSEGKFMLLMSLYEKGSVTPSELALRIGVTAATVSVMLKRMLNAEKPLINISVNQTDSRSKQISLSLYGLKLIQTALPEHLNAIRSFSEILNHEERENLVQLLHKLLRNNAI